MLKSLIAAAGFSIALTGAALAADITPSGGSTANSWGLIGEQAIRFEGTVTDLKCAVTGADCPADCGAGARPLGLVTDAGTLVILAKNTQPVFSGAVADFAPFCGQKVEVDGLMVGEGARIFQPQLVRRAGSGDDFAKTDHFTKDWNERHPDLSAQKGPWFRKDPAVNALIARDGYLGLGLEADETFKAEW